MNRFINKTYQVQGANIADDALGQQINLEKINIAINQALSVWTALAPIRFNRLPEGTNADVSIPFVNNGYTLELGNALVGINTGNSLFIEAYNEANIHPTYIGPFDLIAIIAHEVGHQLGLNHPPLADGTDIETYPDALMSRSFGEGAVERYTNQYDVESIQQLYGHINLNPVVKADLFANVSSGPLDEGVHFFNDGSFIQLDGPVGKSVTLTAHIPLAKGGSLNAVVLDFSTVTSNVIVNKLTVCDGNSILQTYYVSARNYGNEHGQLRDWKLRFGLLQRPTVQYDLKLIIDVELKRRGNDQRWDYGVVQFTSFAAELLEKIFVSRPFAIATR